LGELIDERGVGNGLSILIFGGIVSQVPQTLGGYFLGQQWLQLILMIGIMIITVAAIVVIQEGQRRIPVQYGRRVLAQRGNRLRIAGGQSSWVPLRVNSAGMIPLILAQSLMLLPGTVAARAPSCFSVRKKRHRSSGASILSGRLPRPTAADSISHPVRDCRTV
jgi:preprotein translocase subunit SecY